MWLGTPKPSGVDGSAQTTYVQINLQHLHPHTPACSTEYNLQSVVWYWEVHEVESRLKPNAPPPPYVLVMRFVILSLHTIGKLLLWIATKAASYCTYSIYNLFCFKMCFIYLYFSTFWRGIGWWWWRVNSSSQLSNLTTWQKACHSCDHRVWYTVPTSAQATMT